MKNLKNKTLEILEENKYNFRFINEFIDVNDIFNNWKEFDSLEEFEEEFRENYINTAEIIYYATALEFLKENDPSFQEASWIASDLWYETKNLNSELLATILVQEYLNQELSELISELEKTDL